MIVVFDDATGMMTAYSGRCDWWCRYEAGLMLSLSLWHCVSHRYMDWRYEGFQRGAADTLLAQCAARGEVIRRTLPRTGSHWKSFTSADMKNTLGVPVPFSVDNLLAVPLMAVDAGSGSHPYVYLLRSGTRLECLTTLPCPVFAERTGGTQPLVWRCCSCSTKRLGKRLTPSMMILS